MRNAWRRWVVLAAAVSAGGCNGDPQKVQDKVDAGEVALGGRRYDLAVADATDALASGPSPEAYYLRGRAQEDRPKPDAEIEAADLAKAKTDYRAALALNPGQPLDARCHAGLANVAFTQDDYSTALYQYTTAVDHLDKPEWKAYALYRIGECQQRLGRFDDADQTFDAVARQYPGQDVAARAKAHEGGRGFYVQVGAFSRPADAEKAAAAARNAGANPEEVMNGPLTVVRAGPYSSYTQAKTLKGAVASQFPDAVIVP